MAKVLMEFASRLSEESKCARRQVGCILATPDLRHIVGNGYNGGPKKTDYVCTVEDCRCLHAEDNAVGDVIGQFPEKTAFITAYPCFACTSRLINNGVSKIYYMEDLSPDSKHHKDLPLIQYTLAQRGIEIIKMQI